jgi:hypothetical protein
VGPWGCPNPYFDHATRLPVRGNFTMPRKDGTRAVTAKCSCGMHFTFSRVDSVDPSKPIVDTVRRLAPGLVIQIGLMKRAGSTSRMIARDLGLPINCVKRHARAPAVPGQLEDHRMMLRWAWMECLVNTPGRNRYIARRANRRLYAELAALDPSWLATTGAKRTKPPKLTDEDWCRRDREWSAMLRAAAARIYVKGSLHDPSKTQIIREAGLKIWILSRLDRLPLCRSFFTDGPRSCARFPQ